jgi:iron complex outermembrane receptor protein
MRPHALCHAVRTCCGVLMLCALGWSPGAHSQEQPGAQALEEVIVTARKREEILRDIPVAITAWQFDEIEASGARNLQDLSVRTPGFKFHEQAGQIPGRYNTAVRFRGMDTNQSAPSQQLGTVFVDGVYVSNGVSSLGFENIERVEIIKGPQSAVFGRSTFAGAVNYVTRTPGFEFGGTASATFEEDETYDLSVSLEGPIVAERLAYRVSLRGYGTGGQYTSVTDGGELGDEETRAAQGELYFKASDNLAFKLFTLYAEDSDGPSDGIFLGGANSQRGTGPNFHNCFALHPEFDQPGVSDYFCGEIPDFSADGLTRSNTQLDQFLLDLFTADQATDTFSGVTFNKVDGAPRIDHVGLERENLRLALTATWTPGEGFLKGHQISSITGYNEVTANWIRDFDLTGAQNWYSQDPQLYEDFTQELRLTSPQDQRFRWSVGANYFDVEYNLEGNGGVAAWAYDGQLSFIIPGPIVLITASIPKEGGETQALFGSLGFDFLENLTLDLEWRYQKDEVSIDNPDTAGEDFAEEFENFLPRATVRFKPAEATTLWLTYAEGNLPGFFNSDAVGLSEAELQQIADAIGEANLFNDEESLESWELGWKQDALDNRMFFALVGYFMDWTNQKTRQAVGIIRDTGEPFIANIQTNAGSSELWGVEFETVFSFTDSLSGSASVNWVQGEYQTFRCGFAPFLPDPEKDCSGNTPPRYPEWSGALSLTWEDQLTSEWDYFARWDTYYFGKAFTDETNFAWTSPYWRTNLRLGVERNKLRIDAFVSNLFDDDHVTAAARWSDFSTSELFGFVVDQGIAITPPEKRRFGIRVTYDF